MGEALSQEMGDLRNDEDSEEKEPGRTLEVSLEEVGVRFPTRQSCEHFSSGRRHTDALERAGMSMGPVSVASCEPCRAAVVGERGADLFMIDGNGLGSQGKMSRLREGNMHVSSASANDSYSCG